MRWLFTSAVVFFFAITYLVTTRDDDVARWKKQLGDVSAEVRFEAMRDIYSWSLWFGLLRADVSGAGDDPKEKRIAQAQYDRYKQIGEQLVPALTQACKDKDTRVRSEAVRAIGEMQLSNELSVRTLMEVLKSDSAANVRRNAIYALYHFKKDAEKAVPLLRESLNDQNVEVRRTAAYSFTILGLNDQQVIEPLLKLLNDKDKAVKIASGHALALRRSKAKAAVPIFMKFLKDEDASIRETAAEYLGMLSLDAETVIPALREAAKNDEVYAVRIKAAEAIAKFGR